MKHKLLYSIALDALIPVAVITKHSNGECCVQQILKDGTLATLQVAVSALELQTIDYQVPNKPRFNFVDPNEVMKLGTEYWGSCVMPSPYKDDDGCARWLGRGAKPLLYVQDGRLTDLEPKVQ